MKKKPGIIFLIAGLLIMSACNNSSIETKASRKDKSKNNDTGLSSTKPVVKPRSCCFMDNDEVMPFFPVATGNIKKVQNGTVSGSLYCSEDAEMESGLLQTYTTGTGRLVVKITDYCINPRKLELDYDRRYKNTPKAYGDDKEMKDLSGANGIYKGFAVYSAKNKSSYLLAMVDERFGVTITGVDQEKFDDILRLFELVPVDKLAAFRK
jgi:hypothetical protein